MNIVFDESIGVFKLDTSNTSYLIGIVDEEGFVGHLYYGPYISDTDVAYLARINENPFVPSATTETEGHFLIHFPWKCRGVMWVTTGKAP